MNSQVVDSISAEDMVKNGAIMLPAMNIEDRVELIGGIKDRFPPERVPPALAHRARRCSSPTNAQQLADRLGID